MTILRSSFLDENIKTNLVGKKILAPMVRTGSLPMRLLAKQYGADFVYGPEIVDKRIIGSTRIINEALGTVDYVKNNTLNFRCLTSEKPYLIFQLGTADPAYALEAAKTVAQDVAWIDVNCGCPKPFSIQGGMGAALLHKPDILCNILETLVKNSGVPISAKIRILPDRQATLDLVERIVNTGICALAVHCRTKNERPKDPGHWEAWEYIAEKYGDRIPIIANGDIFTTDDITKAFQIPKVSSIMIARAAQKNPSIFAYPKPPLPIEEVIREFLRYCFQYDNGFSNTKYILLQFMSDFANGGDKAVVHAKKMEDIAEHLGMMPILKQYQVEIQQREIELNTERLDLNCDEN